MDPEFAEVQAHINRVWLLYRRRVYAVLAVLALLWLGMTMYYKVGPDSEGVVLRLGEYSKTAQPGLHFKLPWPIDTYFIVPVRKVQSLEFGYRTEEAGRRSRYARATDDQKILARMLTADLNLAHVEWVVQYRVKDAKLYLFRIGGGAGHAINAADLIQDVSESVMRRIIGDVSVDSVITTGREEIADLAEVEMQQLLDSYESGIHIVTVKLQSATPPEKVKDAFDAVNRAKQNKERVVNDAKGERNDVIPEARGKRDQLILEAEGYALRKVKEANGRANAFLSQLLEYEKAPAITKTRLYIEAMEVVLQQVDEKIIIDETIEGVLPLLNLGDTTGGAR
ncbi:MAG: FtsH protease activity modulator HflK [Planctomycetota bacterium]|nr:FtsH protease activity modulator HflK [Planctomycetota bacterium]